MAGWYFNQGKFKRQLCSHDDCAPYSHEVADIHLHIYRSWKLFQAQEALSICLKEQCATDGLTLASFQFNSVIFFLIKTWNKPDVRDSRMEMTCDFVFKSNTL